MTAGKPILFGIKGEGKKILEQVKINIYCYPESVSSFLEALKRLKENYSKLLQYANDNKRLIEKYYTREKIVDLFENHIRHLYQ
jgi:hypothetical protein